MYARVGRRLIDFGRATVFLLDEFGLPPGNPARCDAMIAARLPGQAASSRRRSSALDPRRPDLEEECRRFESLVDDGGLDLTLLGLGGNGHLGLNEPGTPADAPTRVVRLASTTKVAAGRYGSDVEPEWGMTLGMRPILDSREIWLLVTGSHKAEILDRILHGPIGPDVPASYPANPSERGGVGRRVGSGMPR